jgi:hypothetical protein
MFVLTSRYGEETALRALRLTYLSFSTGFLAQSSQVTQSSRRRASLRKAALTCRFLRMANRGALDIIHAMTYYRAHN